MYSLLEILGAALCIGVVVYYLVIEHNKQKKDEA